MSQHYRLVFDGELVSGMTSEQAIQNLAELFRVGPERIRDLLATLPTTIKQNVDEDVGLRYCEALHRAGIITRLEASPATSSAEASPEPAPTYTGPERRQGERRSGLPRRAARRDNAIQPDRRQGKDRRQSGNGSS